MPTKPMTCWPLSSTSELNKFDRQCHCCSIRLCCLVCSVHGRDLLDNMLTRRTYSERDVALIIRHLVDTVKHLHSRNIVHLDIKVQTKHDDR
jgi:serine/threonine protein kinase